MENFDSIIMGASTEQLSTEEYAAMKKQEREELYSVIDETATKVFADPKALQQYLDMQARLGRATVNNTLLAVAQRPDAKHIFSFDEWKDRGRSLRQGEYENAIKQFRQDKEYIRDDDTTAMGYKVVRCYDLNQTYGKPYREKAILAMPIQSKIKALLTKTPVPVRLSDHVPQNAIYDGQEKEIRVARGLDGNTLFYSLARELAHADYDKSVPDDYIHHLYEFEADCAAYITSARVGIEAPLPSEIPYDLPDRDAEYKKALLRGIRETSCHVADRVEQNLYTERQQQKNMNEQTR